MFFLPLDRYFEKKVITSNVSGYDSVQDRHQKHEHNMSPEFLITYFFARRHIPRL